MSNLFEEKLENYNNQKNQLINIIKNLLVSLEKIDMKKTYHERIKKLLKKVQSDSFKIMIIGEFKRGKSTFINSMLGQEILPAYSTPCTAVINEVKWGDDKKAVLHFKNPLPEKLSENLDSEAREHIEKYKQNKQIPPLNIDVDNMEKYVVINDTFADQNQSVAETPFSKVEMFWSLNICKNGVEIIDSPGLNEHGTRTKVTQDYLTTIDAVVFVMSCQALGSKTEMDFIDNNILGIGHEDIYYICNQFDLVRNEREKQRIKDYAMNKFSKKTKLEKDGIFFISSIDALDGRLDNDENMINRSNILDFEKHLAEFLSNNRGKVKILQPIKEIISTLEDLRNNIIPTEKIMLNKSLDEIKEKYETVKKSLEREEKQKNLIIQKMDNNRYYILNTVDSLGRNFYTQLENQIQTFITDLELENDLKMYKITQIKAQAEIILKETTEKVHAEIKKRQTEWQNNELKPFVESQLKNMFDDIEQKIVDFYNNIDNIKINISGKQKEDFGQSIPPIERFLSALGGFVVAGVGSALVGGMLGFKEMIKSLGPQIAIVASLMVLGITNPVVWIAALLSGGAIQTLLKGKKIKEKLKMKVMKETVKSLQADKEKNIQNIKKSIENKISELIDGTENTLANEISVIRDQFETIINSKKEGEDKVQSRIKLIENANKDFAKYNSDLTTMVFEIAQ